jgi:cytochrome c oxidase subunit 2
VINVSVLWLVLTVLGWVLVSNWNIYPAQYAREAHIVDEALELLTVLAVPVFAFVVSILIYSAFRFRTTGNEGDGPPIKATGRVVAAWLVITVSLAGFILVNPGFVGLAAIRGDSTPDIVIDVTAQRWSWTITYPNGESVTSFEGELVLPVDTRVRFDLTAPDVDVVHSFWIPAFRIKKDVVPGRTTTMLVTPLKKGSFDLDSTMRVQCAELCGIGHAGMSMNVRVVEPAEFEAYLDGLSAQGG